MAQTLTRSAIVPYSTREMFALVGDIDRYSEFLNWCNESHVDSRKAEGDEEVVTATVGISWKDLERRFTTKNIHRPYEHISMELVEGPFSELRGDWRFTPLGDSASKVELDLVFDFSNRVTGSLLGPVFRRISDGQVDAFHQRAVEIYGRRDPRGGT